MKRTTFILTLLLSAVTMMAEEFTIGLFTYQTTSGNEVEIVDADNRIINVCLNPIITYQGVTYSVTSIGESAFSLCRSLTSITIPNSVKSIGNNAFSGCISLNSINIPNSVTSIGYWAFKGTALQNNRTNWENDALYINNCLIAVDASLVGDYKIKENTRLIGGRAFYGCSSLNAVTIPNSVKGIGDWAFAGCTALSSITIPKSVTSIGERAFEGCIYLTTLTIPNSVKSIEKYAFYDCKSLTSVTISESVTSIGNGAFSNCSSLTSITIPNSVMSIGEYAFYGCSSLNSVAIPESVTSIGTSAFGYCSSLTSINIPKSVTSIGTSAFYGCSVLASIHWIVQNTEYPSASQFCDMANQITSLTFGDNVQYIPASFCEGMTKLNSVTIPNSVKSIGDRAFAGCSRLTSITIPNSVTSIGKDAFKGCSVLASIHWIVQNTEYPSTSPFRDMANQITSLTFGDSVQHIPASFCAGMTKLSSVTIPNSVKSIGDYAFSGCSSLTSITIPESVTDNYVNSVITPIKFEEVRTQREVKVINNLVNLRTAQVQWRLDKGYFTADLDSLIDYLKVTPKKEVYKVGFLTEMQLENGLTENKAAKILERARLKAQRKMKYQGPDSLSMLYNYIWENDGEVKSEGLQGFRRDTILTNMIQSLYKGQYTEETIGEIVYIPYTDNVKFEVETNNGYTTSQGIKVPIFEIRAHYNTYLHDLNSQERINLIDKEEKLGHYPGLKISSIEVPNNNVGSAFYGCSSLNSVTIPNSVTSIGEGAFSGCSSLTSITIPNSVKSIGMRAFYGCQSLTSVTIGNSVTSIGDWAFYGCESLTSVTIPNSVTSIGRRAFHGCESLISINIPDGVTSIGGGVFDGCSRLASITIPKSVTSIGGAMLLQTAISKDPSNWEDGALYINDCLIMVSNMVGNFSIKPGTRIIADEAFWRCSNLTSVTIPNSVTSIGRTAFYGCKSLTSVTIPNSVTSIGYGAFKGCTSLTSPVYNAHCFAYMPSSYKGDYTIPNGIKQIVGNAFYYCSSLNSVTIPNSVTSIGEYAFTGCSSLTSVTIPNSVTRIEDGAFKGTALYNNRTNWENGALYINNCLIAVDASLIGDYKIKENTRLIGGSAFYRCSSLNAVTIPNSIKNIGDWAFAGCSSLTSITIPEGVTSIGDGAFKGCESLTSVTIPNSVTRIGKGAFYKCSSLTSIITSATIPADIFMAVTNVPPLPPPPPPAPVQDLVEEELEEEQKEELEEEVIFIVVETMPEFPGGAQAMMRFIRENIQYPPAAQEKGIQGRVICQFVIEKDGKVTDIQVVRSSGEPSLDKEAVRVINSMPKWKPGTQGGKSVRVKYTVPVNFRLQ